MNVARGATDGHARDGDLYEGNNRLMNEETSRRTVRVSLEFLYEEYGPGRLDHLIVSHLKATLPDGMIWKSRSPFVVVKVLGKYYLETEVIYREER